MTTTPGELQEQPESTIGHKPAEVHEPGRPGPAVRGRPVALVPMGDVEPALLDWLAREIQAALGLEVVVLKYLRLPANAFAAQRDQWYATAILDALAEQSRPEWSRVLGVADVDLYVPELNFVFGEADERRGVAVFSTARLHVGAAAEGQFHRRAATEAIHELGHTFGLKHCARTSCVMWFSNTLSETDRKEPRPCPEHARALTYALELEAAVTS